MIIRRAGWGRYFLTVAIGLTSASEAAAEADVETWTSPTFECLSVYHNSRDGDIGPCSIQYRAAGTDEWREGYPLVYDERDRQYRGSLVGLTGDTEYEIELILDGKTVRTAGRTRSDVFPIGKTVYLDDGERGEPLVITESGTPDGWLLVTPRPGVKTCIDVLNLSDNCVVVDADYVIVRGLELKNAAVHALLIKGGRHDVVVENCRMTFWGRIGGPRSMGNIFHGSDSGIYAECGAGRLVLQRNRIENPRGGANDWDTGHPSGPQGISLIQSIGGNVIRYNEIVSTDDHGFNDGFGGGSNFSFEGSPNCDSDIYGNIVEGVWDDAIEAEGANMNVRIWGNYLNRTFVHIATAAVTRGPCYIFRNVFGISRRTHTDQTGVNMLKVGDGRRREIDGREIELPAGRRFVFHNSALQPNGALHGFGGGRTANTVTRNNILWCRGNPYPRDDDEAGNDFRHDLTGHTAYLPSYYMEFYLAPTMLKCHWGRTTIVRQDREISITDMVVAVPNPGIDTGVRLPGFNDDFQGEAPDIGAFERGNEPLLFGRAGMPGERAPWE